MLNGAPAPVGHFEFKRGDVTRFVRRHEFAWEAGMATLTAIYVILSFFEDSAALALNPYTAVLFSLSAVFLTEFGIRYWDAPARTKYLREHWLDLVTSFPLIGPLRALRLLRLLRFLRLGRSVRALTLGREHDAWLVWPCVLLFWVASSYALWLAEHGPNPLITDFRSAMTYAFLTAATVGYGSFTPVTIEGKIIAGFIVFVAIGLIGFTSARLTAFWLGQKDADIPHQLDEIERDVAAIKDLVTRLVAPATVDLVDSDRVERR